MRFEQAEPSAPHNNLRASHRLGGSCGHVQLNPFGHGHSARSATGRDVQHCHLVEAEAANGHI